MTYIEKLTLEFLVLEAIPKGGGIDDGLEFFLNPEKRAKNFSAAKEKANAAIQAVKNSLDNPYRDDEAIAQAILLKLEKKRRGLDI